MEHRGGRRTAVLMTLLIYEAGLPIALGTTKDISEAGLFVKTSYLSIELHQALEFELLYQKKPLFAHKRYRVVVTQKRADGLVLTFDNTAKQNVHKLVAMVEWVKELETHHYRRDSVKKLIRIDDVARENPEQKVD